MSTEPVDSLATLSDFDRAVLEARAVLAQKQLNTPRAGGPMNRAQRRKKEREFLKAVRKAKGKAIKTNV